MLKKLISITLAAAIATQAFASDFSNGQYFFRYKVTSTTAIPPVENPDNDSQAKDITAFFIGSVDDIFSEKLPMKSEWEDDNWQVVEGSLPNGISFDSGRLMFVGTATKEQKSVIVEMKGYDASGSAVASAEVTFDIYQLPSNRKKVDYFAHTNKYSFNQVDIPVGSVDHWKKLYPGPDGINILGRNFDGTPTKAGVYPILVEGFDYLDEAVAAIYGTFTVEDAPQFATIADRIVALPYDGTPYQWSSAVPKILHPIGDAAKVKYYVEVDSSSELPGTLASSTDPYARTLTGAISEFNEQARIRYRAVDTDGVNGYSNWFTIGSGPPSSTCYNSYAINWTINRFDSYQLPLGRAGATIKYEVAAGFSLPDGLSLDDATGLISGKPTTIGTTSVPIEQTITNNGVSDTYSCGPFKISVVPAPITLKIDNLSSQLRVNRPVDVSVVAGGALINPYSIALDPIDGLAPGLSFDPATNKISGSPLVTGVFSPTFTLTNGNGVLKKTSQVFTVHEKLIADNVGPLISIRRYDTSSNLATFTYNEMGVIPGPGNYPLASIVLSDPHDALPSGILFDDQARKLFGGTSLPVGKYGPFKVRLRDASGDTVDGVAETNEFWINITDRADMVANATVPPSFTVNFNDVDGKRPFSVSEPPLAQTLQLTYTINKLLPDGLAFDGTTGLITGRPLKIETLPGYTITVTDSDGYTKDSNEFDITVKEPGQPAVKAMAPITKNVTGSIPSFLTTLPFDFSGLENTLVGGVAGVTYTDYSPTIGGLTYSNGILSGNPTQEFDGNVSLNFTDGASRPGFAKVHLTILPYPMVTTEKPSYNLPRLSDAVDLPIKTKINAGYFGSVSYTLAPASKSLPTGLSPSDGQIVGSTNVAQRSFPGIVIRATDKITGIWDDTDPFTINIVDQTPMAFVLPQHDLVFQVTPDENGLLAIAKRDVFIPSPKPTGSYVKPLTFSIDEPKPDWLGINSATGQLTGTPTRLGRNTAVIRVTDSDTSPSSKEDSVTIKTTLSGFVVPSVMRQTLSVRIGESFKSADPITSTNSVGGVTYASSSVLPTEVAFESDGGYFHGYLNTAGTETWNINASDDDGRGFAKPMTVSVTAVDKLKLTLDQASFEAAQYSAEHPINIVFKAPENAMGNVDYVIEGELPGKLYYKGNGVWTHYASDATVETISNPEDLPSDALTFDVNALTLRGIPSKGGIFGPISLTAIDDHKDTYTDASREENNKASVSFSINVTPVADLQVSRSVETEALSQFTGKSVAAVTVTGAAYGRALVWEKISENLPAGITVITKDNGLSLDGYPTERGEFAGVVYRATDALGRQIDTPPIALTVGDRGALILTPSVNPKPMIVNAGDADMTITATNAAFGKPVTFTLDAAEQIKLPPGVTYDIVDGNLHFKGVSATLGTYKDILVKAADDVGAPAGTLVSFSVFQDGDPITLSPGAQNLIVRADETFATQPQTATGAVGTPVYNLNVDPLPSVFSFNSSTAVLHGQVSTAGEYKFAINLLDSAQRMMAKPVALNVTVVNPLSLTAPEGTFTAKQFSYGNPINVAFAPAKNVIGTVAYKVEGTIPGTYYVKQDNGWVYPLAAGGEQVVLDAADLAADAIVFDPANLTLKGMPSQTGTFADIRLVATDDHADEYASLSDTNRVAYNRAETAPITITVDAADSMSIVNTVAGTEADTESLYQYQTQTAASVAVSNVAYGKPVTWTKVSGSLPTDISTITGADAITYAGFPSAVGTASNIVWKARDAAGREITSKPFSFVVQARKPLAVNPSSNPKGVIVNEGDVNLLVMAADTAYGLPVTWTVTGNLPPTVTYAIDDTGVHFSGVPTVIQKYTGIVVKATDVVGAQQSVSLTINVISSSDPIVLNVSNVTTKVGFGYKMEPPYAAAVLSTSNSYGKLKFTSTDLTSLTGLTLNQDTGAINGIAAATGTFTFSLAVSDETKTRLTAKSVVVNIIPKLSIIAPTQVSVTQGVSTPTTVDTSYKIGSVAYEKGADNWPVGVSVDPTTGTISGIPTGNVGTYSGLTIIGTDSIGDRQPSNTFAILVKPTDALPVISDIPGARLILGTVSSITVFKPTVVDSVSNKNAWTYGGTVYSINQTLPAGMNFDTTTGTISGSPSEGFVLNNVIITVTSATGDFDTTAPFALGVAPDSAMSVDMGSFTSASIRVGKAYATPVPTTLNGVGTIKWTTPTAGLPAGLKIDAATGVVSGTPTTAVAKTVIVTATDELNRTATISYTLTINPALVVTFATTALQIYTDTTYNTTAPTKITAPVVSAGKIGNVSFEYVGLPDGMSASAVGQITGKPLLSGESTHTYPVVLTVKDDFDDTTITINRNIIVDQTVHQYWRMSITSFYSAQRLPSIMEVTPETVTGGALTVASGTPAAAFDGLTTGSAGGYINSWTFASPQAVKNLKVYQSSANSDYRIQTFDMYYSDNGTTYKKYWSYSGATAGLLNTYVVGGITYPAL